jgi:hypothetical protein
MDDPLSAVGAHVGEHIFSRTIAGAIVSVIRGRIFLQPPGWDLSQRLSRKIRLVLSRSQEERRPVRQQTGLVHMAPASRAIINKDLEAVPSIIEFREHTLYRLI